MRLRRKIELAFSFTVLTAGAMVVAWSVANVLSHPKVGQFTGQVFDSKGVPAPAAHVFVRFLKQDRNGVGSASETIALVADDEGKFTVERQLKFRIGMIRVHASSPSNEIGWTEFLVPRDSDEAVTITTAPLSREHQHDRGLQYENFMDLKW